MCKDDHEEKIAKFGGGTIKKVMNLKKSGEETQRIQQVRRCPTLIDLPVHQIQEQRVEVQRVIHNQECMQQQSGVRSVKLFAGG